MKRLAFIALAFLALASPTLVEAQAKPVVAILYFDNNSIGRDRADYDGIGRGMADMLVTDMAQNANITVVERERVQALLTEQNLVKAGSIDPQTAIRLGKIIGAQYMITGGFMSDGRGTFVITSRAINVETSQITNPIKITTKGDDVLGLMSQLSTRLNTEMKLPAMRVGDASAPGAVPAGRPASEAKVVVDDKVQPAETKAAPAETKTVAAPATKSAPVATKAVATAESKPKGKMDMRTALLYSKALEEEDAGNRAKAVELYKQVVDRFPLPAAEAKIRKLSRS